jgi:hypothetical protein
VVPWFADGVELAVLALVDPLPVELSPPDEVVSVPLAVPDVDVVESVPELDELDAGSVVLEVVPPLCVPSVVLEVVPL